MLQEYFPPARIGQPYRIIVDDSFLPAGPDVEYWFEGLEQAGLHFIPEKKQIAGVPKKTGNFTIQMMVKTAKEAENPVFSTRSFSLAVEDEFVIPLEDMPSDDNDPYWKPDEETAIRLVPVINRNWKKDEKKDMAAASKRGRLHIQTGKFREDDFDIRYDSESQWYMLAVADGSGSAALSRRGSQIACESAIDECFDLLATESLTLDALAAEFTYEKMMEIRGKMSGILHRIIASSVIKVHNDIEQEAEKSGFTPEDFATTLLLAICKKYDFGWFIGAFNVGDGAICVYNKDTWFTNLLCIPDGSVSSPSKCYLTMPGMIEPEELSRRIRFNIVEDFSAVFLMTNGVSDPKFESGEEMIYFEAWNRFWKDISKEVDFTRNNKNVAEELLKWLDFWTPEKHDDRTIAVVY